MGNMINHTHFGPSKPFGFSMILHIMCLVVFVFSVGYFFLLKSPAWEDWHFGMISEESTGETVNVYRSRCSCRMLQAEILCYCNQTWRAGKSPLNSVIVSISVLPVRDFWVNVGVEKTMPFVHIIFLN